MSRPIMFALLVAALIACAPAAPPPAPTAPTPTAFPSPLPTLVPTATTAPSATPVPPTATAISTASATPAPSHTPTSTPTNTPTETPSPPTATRAPTRPPATPTPQPVADAGQAPAPACPAWFATPPAGKAALVFENNVREPVIVENLPGVAGAIRLSPAASDGPSLTTVAIAAGTYEITAAATSGDGTVKRTIAAGEMHLIRVAAHSEHYCCPPGTVPHFDVTQSTPQVPWGCPGGQPPQSRQCPAWFATPSAGQAVIVVENRRWSEAVVEAQNSAGKVFSIRVPSATDEGPARNALTLPADRYTFNVQYSPPYVLESGQVFLLPIPGLLVPLPSPPGCPGYVAPPPPPPPTCPAWFKRPEPGKAMLVIENHGGKAPVVTLKGMVGIVLEVQMPPKTGDEPGRYMLMLAPGHYELESSPYGMIVVDLAPGDMKVSPVYAPGVERRPVFDLPVPPACN